MAAKYWLKLYYDILDDPKIGVLSTNLRWRFIECLLVAGEVDEDGFLPTSNEMAWRVRADAERLDTELHELANHGLLTKTNGRWLVTNFAKRQSPVDSTERWRRWRDRQRQEEYNEEQTNFKRNQTEPPTNRLTDTDTDKIRVDKNGTAAPRTHKHEYEISPESYPNANGRERLQDMVSILSAVVKETYAIGLNSDRFEQAAQALIDKGYSEEQVRAFGGWWKANGYYQGKPSIKSLIDEMDNSIGEKVTDWLDDIMRG